MSEPRPEEIDTPLARRIINEHIGRFISTGCATARAGNGTLNEYERGFAAAVDQIQHLHLAGYWYAVTPKLVDALKRANLLREDAES